MKHRAGFISIVGRPNVGKSTLMNAIIGQQLSITTPKAQTTRHRIFGILSGDDFQMVYSDTPGILEPQYELQKSMMHFVRSALEDADLILVMMELDDKLANYHDIINRILKLNLPTLFILNKVDLGKGSQVHDKLAYWKEQLPDQEIITVSALKKSGVDALFNRILELLPKHPAYFPKDELTDKSARFFASEMVRANILALYHQEVPYASEVSITEFIEEENIIRVRAEIYVERDSQKGILIGKGGSQLKKLGQNARLDMEAFFGKKIFLEQHVKVEKDWRKKSDKLKRFGY